MPLISLVYVSFSSHNMSDADLRAILEVAREKNAQLGITGMLLYRDGFFIQVLEGEKDVVVALYDHIKHDARHQAVTTVYEGEIVRRSFSDWTMGFNPIDDASVASVPGFDQFLNPNDEAHGDLSFFTHEPSRATVLLEGFKHQSSI